MRRAAIAFLIGWFLGGSVRGVIDQRAIANQGNPPPAREWDAYVRAEKGLVVSWVFFRIRAADARKAADTAYGYYAGESAEGWRAREVRVYPAETWWIRDPV